MGGSFLIESPAEKKNIKLGKMSNLVPSEENNNNTTATKLMQISLHSFELLQNHSRKFHEQPISYDEIIEELCNFWNEQHKTKYCFH